GYLLLDLTCNRGWRDRFDVGDHVHYSGLAAFQGRLEGGREVARALHAHAEGAHVLGKAREVHHAVRPQLARLGGLLAAIGAVEAALGLVAAGIVVHDRDARDLPAHRGLQVADVVPEAGVAGEDHHRTLG